MTQPAILLYSGGIDSTTTLAIALSQGFRPLLLTFDYHQRHRIEIQKSTRALKQFGGGLQQSIFPIDFTPIGGSALTAHISVPKNRPADDTIPVTYVPARNLIFLSIAAAVGEPRRAFDLFFGANIVDYSGYPDCRPDFIAGLENLLNIATKAGNEGNQFRIHAPLLMWTKAEIIRKGLELGVDYALTHSCYDPAPDGRACGSCDSCRIRLRAFEEVGMKDPAPYQTIPQELR